MDALEAGAEQDLCQDLAIKSAFVIIVFIDLSAHEIALNVNRLAIEVLSGDPFQVRDGYFEQSTGLQLGYPMVDNILHLMALPSMPS